MHIQYRLRNGRDVHLPLTYAGCNVLYHTVAHILCRRHAVHARRTAAKVILRHISCSQVSSGLSNVGCMARRLVSAHRWCVTGTAIGPGNLRDIQGLLGVRPHPHYTWLHAPAKMLSQLIKISWHM